MSVSLGGLMQRDCIGSDQDKGFEVRTDREYAGGRDYQRS